MLGSAPSWQRVVQHNAKNDGSDHDRHGTPDVRSRSRARSDRDGHDDRHRDHGGACRDRHDQRKKLEVTLYQVVHRCPVIDARARFHGPIGLVELPQLIFSKLSHCRTPLRLLRRSVLPDALQTIQPNSRALSVADCRACSTIGWFLLNLLRSRVIRLSSGCLEKIA